MPHKQSGANGLIETGGSVWRQEQISKDLALHKVACLSASISLLYDWSEYLRTFWTLSERRIEFQPVKIIVRLECIGN